MKKRGRKCGGSQTVSSEFAKNRRDDDDESVSANTKSKATIQEFFVRPPLPRKKKSWTVAVKPRRSQTSKNKSVLVESKTP
jgi:hypothetical protein